jgi:C4-dicarboxylate-specific signal transduction histidine kinase
MALWVVGLVGLLLLGLVVALLMQRRQRHLIEAQMTQQRAQLAHAARLATVGELSASIAHEIAQPLAAILANAEAGEKLLGSGRGSPEEIHDILVAIREDDERACMVIQRLRDLLRRAPVQMQPVDINESIRLVARLVSGNAGQRGVQIHTLLDPLLPPVIGDAVQLQQVLLNLMMNAVESMSGSPVERRRVVVDSSVQPDGTVEIGVRDRGHGIPADQLRRIFEPFYSTKQDGMGLGLSISRSIVSAHGGRLWAESGREGTTFRFTLVASEQEGEAGAAVDAAPPAAGQDRPAKVARAT